MALAATIALIGLLILAAMGNVLLVNKPRAPKSVDEASKDVGLIFLMIILVIVIYTTA